MAKWCNIKTLPIVDLIDFANCLTKASSNEWEAIANGYGFNKSSRASAIAMLIQEVQDRNPYCHCKAFHSADRPTTLASHDEFAPALDPRCTWCGKLYSPSVAMMINSFEKAVGIDTKACPECGAHPLGDLCGVRCFSKHREHCPHRTEADDAST